VQYFHSVKDGKKKVETSLGQYADRYQDLKHQKQGEKEGDRKGEGQRMAQMENVVSAQARPEHLTPLNSLTPATWNAQPCIIWGCLLTARPDWQRLHDPRDPKDLTRDAHSIREKDGEFHSSPRRSIAMDFSRNASRRAAAWNPILPP
jgi:hypothetical protein